MGKCEACVCGLYGQIKCGCLDAKDQGVTCSGVCCIIIGIYLIRKMTYNIKYYDTHKHDCIITQKFELFWLISHITG